MRQKFYRTRPFATFFSVACSLFLLTPILDGKEFSIVDTFKTHCVECHGAKGKVKGEVNLVSYLEGEDIKDDAELLQTVMEVIDFGEMPPEENNPIPKDERQIIVKHLKEMLEEAVKSKDFVLPERRLLLP